MKRDWPSHDIDLPVWGPYNKQYIGFSHIADPVRGLRFDIDVFPGMYRRSVMDTRATCDSGVRMWQARTDLKRFVYRYELLDEDRLYLETDFTQQAENANIRCTFVNNTSLPQSVQADFCFSLRIPTFYGFPCPASDVSTPAGVQWLNAAAYDHQDGLTGITHDGFRLGERPLPYAVEGHVLELPPQHVSLRYNISTATEDSILIRYSTKEDALLTVNGRSCLLKASDRLTEMCFVISSDSDCLVIEATAPGLLLDGYAIGKHAENTAFSPWPDAFIPGISDTCNSVTLHYPLIPQDYTIQWDNCEHIVRQLQGENDGDILSRNIHNHVSVTLRGSGKGCYTDLFIRPVFLQPHETKTLSIRLSAGSTPTQISVPPLPALSVNPSGQKYRSSMERLSAVTALNVVYPSYYRGKYIRTYTPGRNWDSYYTWDSGMIALGLMTMDRTRAMQSIRTYLMPQEDEHSPYLNHGSPVITQFFGFKQLLDKGAYEDCRALYPAFRYIYRYLFSLPRHGGLIATWGIFYNSGGWDDYPTQKYIHEHGLKEQTAAVISSALMLIYADILSGAAHMFGMEADIEYYKRSAAQLETALEACWDEETGYYGYSTCGSDGDFTGILRDENGININQGLDGLYPLIAGIGSSKQKRKMLSNIRHGLMTPIGISVVDTRSPYFIDSGYWNGSVWMPHQWILWKALLDLGEADLAHRIAKTAMNLWKKETDISGNCYEHFMLKTGRGAGFHHFSGLSSPVLDWYQSYFTPGTVTVGFRTLIREQVWNHELTEVTIVLETPADRAAVLLTLQGEYDYRFTGLPETVSVKKLHPGTYCLQWKARQTVTIHAEIQ